MENLSLSDFGPALLVVVLFIVLYLAVRFILRRQSSGHVDRSLVKQSILFVIVTVAAIAFLLTLPIEPDTKDRITTLLGYMISAIVALSSATFFGNMLAGILLRIVSSFKAGDYIRVQDHYGRVSEKSLFHTELQTVDGNFITLPNLFLSTHPVKVTRSTDTIISTEVSLGYNVSRLKIEQCLIQAAEKAGLSDAFVYITVLGDFSVLYKIHGKQQKIKKLLDAKSRLNAMVLDALHEANIEIVSPSFMNQRQVADTTFIPRKEKAPQVDLQLTQDTDSLIFGKAEKAETIEEKKMRIETIEIKISELQESIKKATEEERIEQQKLIKRYTELIEKMKKSLENKVDELKDQA